MLEFQAFCMMQYLHGGCGTYLRGQGGGGGVGLFNFAKKNGISPP